MTREPHKVLRAKLAKLSEIKDSIEFVDDGLYKEIQKELILKYLDESPSDSGENATSSNRENSKESIIEVFLSYSHEDEPLCNQLLNHLSSLRQQGMIKKWHDRQIRGGKERSHEIDQHLDTAHIVLLLVSSDFIGSDYHMIVEMQQAMKRHEAGETRVIPVILRPVDWDGTPFTKLEPLPPNRCAVTSWQNQDEAFRDIAKGIRAVVEEMAGHTTVSLNKS